MKKWLIPLLAILFLGTAANGYLYLNQAEALRSTGADVAGLQENVSGLQERINSLDAGVRDLNGTLSGLSTDVRSLQTDSKSTRDGVTALRGDLQTLSGSVSGLLATLNNVQQAQANAPPPPVVDFTAATTNVERSVVVIETQTVVPLFPGRRLIQRGAGSGWIINSNGIIVTNAHVIADANTIKVTLADGRSFSSNGVQSDPVTDVAVIRVDAQNLPTVKVGDSDKLSVGQPVAAIGNALGLGINMTGGWVSRLNTTITFSDGSTLSGLIGTDAAINPGNSGGPLINVNGEVVGITNAKLVESGVEGIGYAISINNALKTINSLIAKF